MSQIQSYQYNIADFINNNNEIVVFDGTSNHKIAKNIVWNQPALSMNFIELSLLPYGSTSPSIWRGYAGETIIDAGKYQKIVLKFLPLDESTSNTEEENKLVGVIAPDNYYNKILTQTTDEPKSYVFFGENDITNMTITKEGMLVDNTDTSKKYCILGVVGAFDPANLFISDPNSAHVQNFGVTADGTLSWIEEEYYGEEPGEFDEEEQLSRVCRLQLITIPAGIDFHEIIDNTRVEEYVDLFYTLDKPIIDSEQPSEIPNDQLIIEGFEPFVAKENWSAAVPGRLINPEAIITKGENVRIDVYVKYWTTEKARV